MTVNDSTTKSPQVESTIKSSQTGGNANLALWIVLLFGSGGACMISAVGRRKKHSI